MNLKIIFIFGAVIITVSSLGLGANFDGTSISNMIGGDDNISASDDTGKISDVRLVRHNPTQEFQQARVYVVNDDSIDHTYEVCVVAQETGTSTSADVGDPANCIDLSVSAGSENNGYVDFDNFIDFNSPSVDFTSVTIEQIS